MTDAVPDLTIDLLGVGPQPDAFHWYAAKTTDGAMIAVITESPIHVAADGHAFRIVNTLSVEAGEQMSGANWSGHRTVEDAITWLRRRWAEGEGARRKREAVALQLST